MAISGNIPVDYQRELPSLPDDVSVEVQRILDAVGTGTSVFMTGSIVEGFGNIHSDVDLYVVQDEGRPEQSVAIGMRRSRYVDCEYFPSGALRRLSARVGAGDWAQLGTLRDAEIDRYSRFARGVPLRITSEFAAVSATFDRGVASALFGKLALRRAYGLFGGAVLLAASGDERGSDLTLRSAAIWTATAEMAAEGEGYPSQKWVGEKAARLYGRGSQKFESIIGECFRPSGALAQRLARLRERLPIPPGLAEVLDGPGFALAAGVRPVQNGTDWLFVHKSLGVANLRGRVGAAIASLSQGVSWLQATEELARDTGIAAREARAGLSHESATLRGTGHLIEQRSTNG